MPKCSYVGERTFRTKETLPIVFKEKKEPGLKNKVWN